MAAQYIRDVIGHARCQLSTSSTNLYVGIIYAGMSAITDYTMQWSRIAPLKDVCRKVHRRSIRLYAALRRLAAPKCDLCWQTGFDDFLSFLVIVKIFTSTGC
jgi:hypothetical protein